ncbi:lipopolysaccharide biosynthesis protein [Psychrobacillus lasiicapitis]|nr:oligosaccharide flippase family protein [Psychrobacillus lasiicapitis]GGA20479.1 hypothetical protein GCM10011384_07410 [Psychrobacillus lasiicapitis]
MMKKILKSDFNKNVLTLLTGTTIAQVIPIAISPLLTRIYTPEDFGTFAIILAVTSIISTIATARYEIAIVLPKKDEDAINLVALSMGIAILISSISLITIVFFENTIKSILGKDFSYVYLYSIPTIVFFTGFYNSLKYYFIRKKLYKDLSTTNMFRASVLSTTQITFGYLSLGSLGLILGQVISSIFANSRMFLKYFVDWKESDDKSLKSVKTVAKEYISLPKFSAAGSFINASAQNVNNLLLPMVFNNQLLGFYSLVNRILGTPTTLIASSISQVYFQSASAEKNQKGNNILSFTSTLKKLIILSIPLFGVLYLIIDNFIVLIFGKDWEMLEPISKLLLPLFLIRFISSTLSTTLNIHRKEKEFLLVNIILFLVSVLILIVAKVVSLSIFEYFGFQSIILSILYLLLLYRYYIISKG